MKKTLVLTLALFIFQYSANSRQKEEGSIKTALLIVDIQNFYFPGDGPGLVNAEAAVRAGHDFGFECIVVHDACATRDLMFNDRIIKAEDVHASTLATIAGGGYGKVIDLKTFKENTDKYLQQKID